MALHAILIEEFLNALGPKRMRIIRAHERRGKDEGCRKEDGGSDHGRKRNPEVCQNFEVSANGIWEGGETVRWSASFSSLVLEISLGAGAFIRGKIIDVRMVNENQDVSPNLIVSKIVCGFIGRPNRFESFTPSFADCRSRLAQKFAA